jgi:hypothetical protein
MMNGLLSIAVFAFALLCLELAFPLFVEVTDDVRYENLPKVGLRLRPYQEGIFLRDTLRGADEIRGRFRVNNAGFNNSHDYSARRSTEKYRIAVVGDSFVEALQVDQQDAFFNVMERTLADNGVNAEVYSFGVSGYGSAQIYHMINLSYDQRVRSRLFSRPDHLPVRCQ